MVFSAEVRIRDVPCAFKSDKWLMPAIVFLSILPVSALFAMSLFTFVIPMHYIIAIFAGILAYIAGHTSIMKKIEKHGIGGGSVYLTQYNIYAAPVAQALPRGMRWKGWYYFCSIGQDLTGYIPEKKEMGALLLSDENGGYVLLPTGYSPMLPGVAVPYVKFYANHKDFRRACEEIAV